MYLSCYRLDDPWEIMVLGFTMLHPWGEVSQFSIISRVSHPHLRANEKNFVIIDDNPTIVDHVLVYDGPLQDVRTGEYI